MAGQVDWSVYVITDSRLCGRPLLACVEQALRAGATVIQLRDKQATTRQLVEMGRALAELCRRFGATFIVNDRVDVALAVEADGVHVGTDDMPVALARRLMGPGRIVGASVESPEEARQAEREGADYLGVGPIFATSTKPDAGEPRGPQLLQAVRQVTRLPLVAISGITAANAPLAIQAGADGVAVISAVMAAPDPEAATRQLALAVRRALAQRGAGAASGRPGSTPLEGPTGPA